MNQSQLAAQVTAHEETIRTMDGLSQDGFGRISALAQVAMLAFESEAKSRNAEPFFGVFESIRSIAEDMQNCINVEAERAGCNYEDPATTRRHAAARRASLAQKSEGAAQ